MMTHDDVILFEDLHLKTEELCLEGTETSEDMRDSVNMLLERNRCKSGHLEQRIRKKY